MRTLTISLLAVILIATIGLGWLFDRVYEQYSTSESNQSEQGSETVHALEQLGKNLASTLEQLPNKQEFVRLWSAQANDNSRPLSNSPYKLMLKPLADFPLPQQLKVKLTLGKPLLLATNNNLAFHYYLAKSDELLIVETPLPTNKNNEKSQNYIFTVLFYLALLLLFLLWLTPLVGRLIKLRKTAKSFGEGNFSQRLNISSTSYIRDIEIEFNFMAQRIENLIADVKLLSSAVSHDLRTPLARIRFGIDTLQEEDDPILRRKFEQKISRNVDEMTGLVETLLNYARLDQAMLAIRKDNVDLTQIIEHSVQSKTVENTNIYFEKSAADYIVVGDPVYLSMLVNNLLQNALQYCDKKVFIELSMHKNNIVMTITDDGQGINIAQRENLLKPFVRGDSHQETHQQGKPIIKGHGIGLAIVKRIVDWHQGEVEINNSVKYSGAEFTIILPKRK